MGKVFDKDSVASRREIPPIVMRADGTRRLSELHQQLAQAEEERRKEALRTLSMVFPNMMVCQCGSSSCQTVRLKRMLLAMLAVLVLVMVHDYFFVWMISKRKCPGEQF